ncbi:hypothetical protein O999_25185 [Pseudomonas putida LF54]|nr:hypothetical protein O999_25185 [Pseudomonas putida LF54]
MMLSIMSFDDSGILEMGVVFRQMDGNAEEKIVILGSYPFHFCA